MTRPTWIVAAGLVMAFAPEASAQIIIVPAPPVIFVPSGMIITNYRRPIGVLVPVVPIYGSMDGRVVVKVIGPRPRSFVPDPEPDLRGVDLDVVGPEAPLQPGFKPDLAKIAPKKPLEKVDVAKAVEPLAKPKAIPEPPKNEVPPPPKPVPVAKAVPKGLLEPKAGPLDEGRRLTELGLLAFSGREYGLAARRFQQAIDAEPARSLPYFLLAQGDMALGKYKDAALAIEKGMLLEDNWPLSAFQPRVDLYKGIEDDWLLHVNQLADAQAHSPNQPAYLFLQAYQFWFDGQRDRAVPLFARAKVLAPGNPFIDAFLKVAP